MAGSARLRSSIQTQLTSYTNSARHRKASQLGRESTLTLCASRLATGDERELESVIIIIIIIIIIMIIIIIIIIISIMITIVIISIMIIIIVVIVIIIMTV